MRLESTGVTFRHLLVAITAALCASALGCRPRNTPDRADAAATTTITAASSEETCVDRWLAARGLDSFGSPHDTAYAGGSPLFDETTGKTTARLDYVYEKQPEAREACAPEAGRRR